MVRIWSWNVNGRSLWDRLVPGEVDIALLQEAPVPPVGWEGRVVPDPAGGWSTAGWQRARRTAIIDVSGTLDVVPRETRSLGQVLTGAVAVSFPGTLAVVDVTVDGETITLVSMYAAWESPPTGERPIFADASAHRLLSDLAGIVTRRRGHRIIAAGDLNILNRYGEDANAYWGGRYATVFDRAAAMGLRFVGPRAPHGRQASPRPAELPEGSLDVPTYHPARQGPIGASRQLDFVFASQGLVERVSVCALNAVDEWGPSDHCRIQIDLS